MLDPEARSAAHAGQFFPRYAKGTLAVAASPGNRGQERPPISPRPYQ